MFKIYIYIIGFFLVGLFTSCNDWTKIEPVEIENKKFETENPQEYAKYLENLRVYKKSFHKVMYVTFDNSVKKSFSKSQHISVLPDSVDIVSLMYPNNLPMWQYKEMKETQTKKGTKFILTISYEGVKIVYDSEKAKVEALGDDQKLKEFPEFGTFLIDSLQNSIATVKKYGYDGINFKYNGQFLMLKNKIEKIKIKRLQNLLVTIIKHWKSVNKEKILLFEGLPQNLLDKSFLSDCNYIIIVANKIIGPDAIDLKINQALKESVPVDKFIVVVDNVSNDPQKTSQGYWGMTNKYKATDGAALYATKEHSGFTVLGMGIYEINLDYYNKKAVYQSVRSAIGQMNPALKN